MVTAPVDYDIPNVYTCATAGRIPGWNRRNAGPAFRQTPPPPQLRGCDYLHLSTTFYAHHHHAPYTVGALGTYTNLRFTPPSHLLPTDDTQYGQLVTMLVLDGRTVSHLRGGLPRVCRRHDSHPVGVLRTLLVQWALPSTDRTRCVYTLHTFSGGLYPGRLWFGWSVWWRWIHPNLNGRCYLPVCTQFITPPARPRWMVLRTFFPCHHCPA